MSGLQRAREVWRQHGAGDALMVAVERSGGWIELRRQPEVLRRWQDDIDPVMTDRLIEVRKSLRELGWEARAYVAIMRWVVGGHRAVELAARPRHVGAGANCVGLDWVARALGDDPQGRGRTWVTRRLFMVDPLEVEATSFACQLHEQAMLRVMLAGEQRLHQWSSAHERAAEAEGWRLQVDHQGTAALAPIAPNGLWPDLGALATHVLNDGSDLCAAARAHLRTHAEPLWGELLGLAGGYVDDADGSWVSASSVAVRMG